MCCSSSLLETICKDKEAVIGWLRVDGEQTDFSFFLFHG